jgi:hypothetical protein
MDRVALAAVVLDDFGWDSGCQNFINYKIRKPLIKVMDCKLMILYVNAYCCHIHLLATGCCDVKNTTND